jgi:hypothetical protein
MLGDAVKASLKGWVFCIQYRRSADIIVEFKLSGPHRGANAETFVTFDLPNRIYVVTQHRSATTARMIVKKTISKPQTGAQPAGSRRIGVGAGELRRPGTGAGRVRESPVAEKPELMLLTQYALCAKLAHPVLSFFAIDMGEESSYTSEAPEGVKSAGRSLKIAISS